MIDTLLRPKKKTITAVSTCRGVYGQSKETEIPSHRLMEVLKQRCKKVVVTEDEAAPGDFVNIAL